MSARNLTCPICSSPRSVWRRAERAVPTARRRPHSRRHGASRAPARRGALSPLVDGRPTCSLWAASGRASPRRSPSRRSTSTGALCAIRWRALWHQRRVPKWRESQGAGTGGVFFFQGSQEVLARRALKRGGRGEDLGGGSREGPRGGLEGRNRAASPSAPPMQRSRADGSGVQSGETRQNTWAEGGIAPAVVVAIRHASGSTIASCAQWPHALVSVGCGQ